MSYSADPYRPPGAAPDSAADDDRSARRVLLLFAFSLIVVGLGGLVAISVRHTGGDNPKVAAGGPLPSAGLGPSPGEPLPAYLEARRAALASASGNRAAVVSFGKYVNEAQARAAVGKLTITSLLAAVPGGTPSVVTGGMPQWVEAQVAEKRGERDEIKRLIPTVDDAQFKKFYEEEVARLSKLVDSVKPDGPLVFGAVVKGPVVDLQAVAKAPDVRLVDVAPSADVTPETPVRGIRPEEAERANDPPTRPV
ncbi:MAG TPA: hypothetical protein VE760_07795 [Acidimicrobiales bacterium]|nr:hypothetical protein [Acidimicrobiales bacterium]